MFSLKKVVVDFQTLVFLNILCVCAHQSSKGAVLALMAPRPPKTVPLEDFKKNPKGGSISSKAPESSKGAVLGGLGPQTAKTAPLEDSGAAAAAAAKLEMSRGA